MNRLIRTLAMCMAQMAIVLMGSAQSDTTIQLEAIPGMQYDMVRLKVPPGTKITLTLSNRDDMSHNLVVTQPDSRVKVVEAGMALAERGPEMNFVPDIPEVLWSIPVLAPGEEASVTFTVPDQESVLPFVCTFPGHGFIMYGAIYVTTGELPPLESDENVPEHRRSEKAAHVDVEGHEHLIKPHPYPLDPPYYYRIFMPNASPASIAVRLTDEISYCWDAGPCQLLYAWQGGFIDNEVAWKGHRNTESRILGTIFYTEDEHSSLRFGDKNKVSDQVEFLGYQLQDRNPEFHYSLDGVEVYEKFEVSEDGRFLLRNFRIPQATQMTWLPVNNTVKSEQGEIANGYLKLTPEQARTFSIKIPIRHIK